MKLGNLDQVEWEKISTNRDQGALPPGEYICVVLEVEDKADPGKTPVTIVKSEVQEPLDHVGRQIWDFIYPTTKKGGVNKAGMGQIKGWAIATVGQERITSPDFDTKEFEGQSVRILTGLESYQVEDDTPGVAPGTMKSKQKTVIAKVLKV